MFQKYAKESIKELPYVEEKYEIQWQQIGIYTYRCPMNFQACILQHESNIHVIKCMHERWRCPWCNGYHRRKWTRRHEFKSWTRLIAFHIALIPLGKVWIQLFSLQLGQTRLFSLGEATSLGKGILWIQTC